MMKINKKIKAFMSIIMACFMCVGVLLSIKTDVYADSSKEYVYDNAGILTADEISKLKSQCKKASEDSECDIVIITTNIGHDGSTMDSYLKKFLDDNGYSKNAVIYDVGAGTGSVSIEAALQGENLRVYAIEKNPEGAELIRKNMQKFRTDQIQVIEGVAPEALEALEMPTHAFIGGSTGQLKEIIQCIKKKNPDVRIVINAISLETVKEAMEAMEEGLLADPEIIQLNVAKSKKLGRYHMMTGLNPIYIISDGGDTE